AAANHAVPADPHRVQQVEQFAPDVENTRPFGPQQPFMPVGRQKIDRGAAHVEGQHAQPLDSIDEEIGAALPAQRADTVKVVAEAAGVFDEAETDQAGAAVHGGAQVLDPEPAVAAGDGSDLDPAAGQVHPRVQVGRVLLGGSYDVVAGPPR